MTNIIDLEARRAEILKAELVRAYIEGESDSPTSHVENTAETTPQIENVTDTVEHLSNAAEALRDMMLAHAKGALVGPMHPAKMKLATMVLKALGLGWHLEYRQ